jgi:acetyl-CoA carboxylase carboxyltransferase component
MCHRELGTDLVFAWPSAEIAVMAAEGATDIIFRREIEAADDPTQMKKEKVQEYKKQFGNPFISASRGHIDDVIDPDATRETIARSLDLLIDKEQSLPARKHGNMPL